MGNVAALAGGSTGATRAAGRPGHFARASSGGTCGTELAAGRRRGGGLELVTEECLPLGDARLFIGLLIRLFDLCRVDVDAVPEVGVGLLGPPVVEGDSGSGGIRDRRLVRAGLEPI